MTLSHHASDPVPTRMPTWLTILLLLCVALLFAGELASVSAVSGWWFDDLFSLWASERTVPFTVAFRERILPDSNPPLYFSLLYIVRQLIPDDGNSVIAFNISAIIAAAVAVYIPSRQAGLSGLATAGIAAFVLSGPVLYFAPEGRSYLMALSVVFVASWYASLAIAGFPEQLTLTRCVILGGLAALTHVYAALFCGSLAAGLVALAILSNRKELLKPGLALGLSASVVFGLWLGVAFGAIDRIAWITFSWRKVLDAALSVKELAIGSDVAVLVTLSLFVFGLSAKATRSLFIVFFIAFALFAVLPVIASFFQPIIVSRYWEIGAAAFPVVVLFAAKTWILEGLRAHPLLMESKAGSRFLFWRASLSENRFALFRTHSGAWSDMRLIAGAAALCLLAACSVLGFAKARYYMPTKAFWNGAGLVRPLLAHCREGSVHVYYENPTNPYVSWPWAMLSFHRLTGASQAVFLDSRESSTPTLDARASSCPVLGWAEHSWDWQEMADKELLKLLRIEASLDDVEIIRHKTGFVVLTRHPSHASAS